MKATTACTVNRVIEDISKSKLNGKPSKAIKVQGVEENPRNTWAIYVQIDGTHSLTIHIGTTRS